MTELPLRVTLSVGVAETLELPSLARGGYVWVAKVEDESVVEAATDFRAAAAGPNGSPAGFSRSELLTLRGRAAGTTRVQLVQRRGWEQGVEPLAAHMLTVDVVAPPAKSGG
jgi:predicted secreted protein